MSWQMDVTIRVFRRALSCCVFPSSLLLSPLVFAADPAELVIVDPLIVGGDASGSAISGDGKVVGGWSNSTNGTYEAFRWSQGTGSVGLGDLAGSSFQSSIAAASADGSVLVGNGRSAAIGTEGFRWTAATGVVGLGDLPGGSTFSRAMDVSADGAEVVGMSGGYGGE